MKYKHPLKLIFSKRMLMELPDFFLKFVPSYIITRFIERPKQLWLISERPDDARDNGYVLFKWLRENHPELNVFYAIKRDSVDYPKVEQLGNVIEWASWEHFKIYCTASIRCSTHGDLGAPVYLPIRMVRWFMPVKGRKVFLQHGIIMNFLGYCRKDKMGADLFVCGAYPEWNYLSQNLGYEDNEVKYLGLARYDCLESTCVKKQILYMPTWRIYLNNIRDVNFTYSTYYQTISQFLESVELQAFLRDSGTEFIFFLHPAFKRKKFLFEHLANENIKVLNNDDMDMQVLLKTCSLLITDFSSINFDVAYMNKPVIYYQFDEEDFRQKHYPEGYFSYVRDGFGPVFDNYQEVMSYIKKLDDTNFINPVCYSQRVEQTFKFRDKNNCLRHYQELCRMDGISPKI